jgi:hypothetical protein
MFKTTNKLPSTGFTKGINQACTGSETKSSPRILCIQLSTYHKGVRRKPHRNENKQETKALTLKVLVALTQSSSPLKYSPGKKKIAKYLQALKRPSATLCIGTCNMEPRATLGLEIHLRAVVRRLTD